MLNWRRKTTNKSQTNFDMNTVKSESGTPDAGEWSKAVQGYAEKGKLITFPSGKKVKTPYQRPFQRMGFASQDTLEKWMKQGMSMAAIAECLEKDIHISAMGSSVSETQKKAKEAAALVTEAVRKLKEAAALMKDGLRELPGPDDLCVICQVNPSLFPMLFLADIERKPTGRHRKPHPCPPSLLPDCSRTVSRVSTEGIKK